MRKSQPSQNSSGGQSEPQSLQDNSRLDGNLVRGMPLESAICSSSRKTSRSVLIPSTDVEPCGKELITQVEGSDAIDSGLIDEEALEIRLEFVPYNPRSNPGGKPIWLSLRQEASRIEEIIDKIQEGTHQCVRHVHCSLQRVIKLCEETNADVFSSRSTWADGSVDQFEMRVRGGQNFSDIVKEMGIGQSIEKAVFHADQLKKLMNIEKMRDELSELYSSQKVRLVSRLRDAIYDLRTEAKRLEDLDVERELNRFVKKARQRQFPEKAWLAYYAKRLASKKIRYQAIRVGRAS